MNNGWFGNNTGLIANEIALFGGVKLLGLRNKESKDGADGYLEMKYTGGI